MLPHVVRRFAEAIRSGENDPRRADGRRVLAPCEDPHAAPRVTARGDVLERNISGVAGLDAVAAVVVRIDVSRPPRFVAPRMSTPVR